MRDRSRGTFSYDSYGKSAGKNVFWQLLQSNVQAIDSQRY
ncbi:hypothetical protein CBM2589_U10183 [Cupriavidus taiwanensis]|uniref:Uncharacterized protein n=1 Tax=Cupriavidus taiwanensis TaxID=164546 RepID=A0A375CRF2_9BURK|nr:hypothetical protein CBM2589_U10183 [Cupriavidus taiwanensis]